MSAEPRELLLSNLALIERAVAFASRRHRLTPEDAEEFAAVVNLRLVENDYAILRAFEGRSSPATYFGIVVQRMLFDYRNHKWGTWHDSAEAKRLGPLAIELERSLYRDKLSFDEAFAALKKRDESLSRDALESLAKRLPERGPKRREVPLEHATRVAVSSAESIEADAAAGNRRDVAERVSSLVNELMDKLPDADRLLLQLRFQEGMTVAQIARATRDDQKSLYRRIERCMRDIRRQMESTGLAPDEVLDLIGRDDTVLDFQLRKPAPRPSIDRHEQTAASHPEEP